MKLPSLNTAALTDVAVRHGEKVVAAIAGVGALLLVWGGVDALRSLSVKESQTPAAVNQAAAVIEDLLARTLAGGTPTDVDRRVAGVVADIWLANLTAFLGQRATAAQTRERITEATRRILANLALSSTA